MERTMMIVDDIEMNRAMLKRIFQGEFNFLEAASGEDAIAQLQARTEKIDILILDISMPGISGIELLHLYRKQPFLENVPVVVVTSSDKTGDQLEAFDAGANDFITKPFNPQIVRTRIHNVWVSAEKLHEIEHQKQLLEDKASRDAMTGLLNKPAALEIIRERLSKNPQGINALMMIDIDNFKGVNDRKGHLAGDRVIKLVAREMLRVFRKDDIVARFGGDEFCIFLAGLPGKDIARGKAQALSGAIMLQSDQQASIPFSVSVGLAFGEPGCSCEELIGWADEALYMSKENGKARVSEYQFGRDHTTAISELNEADAHMRNLLNRIPTGVGVLYFYPDQRMRFGYFNDSFYAMLGESREERQKYIGNTTFESVHPSDVQRAIDEARAIVREHRSGGIEVRLRHRDGSYRWYQARASVTESTDESATLFLSFLDINRERMQQTELREKQAIIDISVDNGSIGLWRFNLDTRQLVQDYTRHTLDGIERVIDNMPQGLIASGVIHPDSTEAICHCYEDILNGCGRSECTVQVYSRPGGCYEWNRIVLVRQPDSEAYGRTAVGFCLNVDQEVRARQKAQENERLLALALDFSGVYCWTYEVDSGIVSLSEGLQRRLGLPATERNYPECILKTGFIHPQYISLFAEKTEAIRQGAEKVDFEVQAYGRSKALHWLRVRICALRRAGGRTQKAVCTVAVIDAEKAAQAPV